MSNPNVIFDFIVYFEIFGKKMKAKIIAENEQDAKQKIIHMLKFYKIEKAKSANNDLTDTFEDIFNFLK
jgi:hypothetical protein